MLEGVKIDLERAMEKRGLTLGSSERRNHDQS